MPSGFWTSLPTLCRVLGLCEQSSVLTWHLQSDESHNKLDKVAKRETVVCCRAQLHIEDSCSLGTVFKKGRKESLESVKK